MILETLSELNGLYIVELSWGESRTIISRFRFAGETLFHSASFQERFRAEHVPVGETIYYRMKTATDVANTCTVHFRYYLLD
ncbi:hypothetical protein ES703_70927 [subsurface metagenome]